MTGIFIPRSVVQQVADCGIRVVEWEGAETRSASQGGFKSVEGVIEHHTADAPPHGSSSWQYATYNDDAGPEYNFGIDLDGSCNWLASGGVNSSGKGGPLYLQTGYVGTNDANYRLPAVCLDIDGVGERCSKKMIITAVVLTAFLLRWQHRQPGDCTAHKEYCGPGTTTPGRKVDPFGPWENGVYGSGLDWGPQQGRIDDFRSQLFWAIGDPKAWYQQQTGTTPPPQPEPEPEPIPPLEDEMRYFVWKNQNGGYCMGIPGLWGCHIDSEGLKDEAFASGAAINLANGKLVKSWSEATTVNDSTAKPKFPQWLGTNYGV